MESFDDLDASDLDEELFVVVGVAVVVVGVVVVADEPEDPLGQKETVNSTPLAGQLWVFRSSLGYRYASVQPSASHVMALHSVGTVTPLEIVGVMDMGTLKPDLPVTDLQSAKLLQLPGYIS